MEFIKTRLTSASAWELPKLKSSHAPPGVWTNIDNDVTPNSRRTWNMLMIVGFWASDYLSMQSYESPSSALSVGLSWREALINAIVGMVIIALPMVFNGAIGALFHIPFAISVRASYGYHFAKFAIVVRMITALFWHAIQTYSGSLSMWLMITAIWPSFDDVPNKIASNIGITTSQMTAHFIFWSIQFPIMLIPPHKLRWFFVFKTVVVTACLIGMAAGLSGLSNSTGDIWEFEPTVSGSEKSWLHLNVLMGTIGGWATMATNISDFTRYMKNGNKSQFAQVAVIPTWATFVSMMAIICSSAGKVVYGHYIWSPTEFCEHWIPTGSKGRAASFFVCFSWCVAQIGTNLSANVISAANDLTSLFPKYLNIRRSAAIVTFVAGWVMQPWKIVTDAGSLISFMAGVSLFLVPIFTVIVTDFWIIKKRKLHVPQLYDPHGIYRYNYGINWRAAVTFIVSLVPNLPGLAHNVNPSVALSTGGERLADISYLYGFGSAFVTYYGLNLLFPHKPSLIDEAVFGDEVIGSEDNESSVEEVNVSINGKAMS